MTLYALFIGINAYPSAPLRGCINDALAMGAYLQQRCASTGAGFEPRYLLAPHPYEQTALALQGVTRYTLPTRRQVIAAFSHFDKAGAGDVCLLYYSGHGSQEPAAPEFRHLKADGMNETLVCLDSRQPGGRDLVDKELAWLLWQVTKDRPNLHFLVVMDCCHAGSNTRGDTESLRVRQVAPRADGTPLAELAGLGQLPDGAEALFDLREGRAYYRAEGRYVHLAAARDTETAKELGIEGRARGVFTWSLLRTLEQGGAAVSYREIMRRTEALVRNRVEGQIPQLDAPVKALAAERFLGGVPAAEPEYPVQYREGEWRLLAGSLQGLVPGTDTVPTLIQLVNGSRSLATVTAVYASYAVLDALPGEDPHDETLRAVIRQMPAPRIAVWVRHGPFVEPLRAAPTRYTDFTTAGEETADYILQTEAGAASLYLPDGTTPVFRGGADPAVVLEACEAIGKWRFVLELHNPESRLPRNAIAVTVEVIEGQEIAPATLNFCSGVPLDDPEEVTLRYTPADNGWRQPALRCTVRALRDGLWVGGMYLDNRFGIAVNLPPRELLAGQEHRFGFETGGVTYNAIPVQIEAALLARGVRAITDYLKIAVSTHDFSLSDLEQPPLPPDLSGGRLRGQGFGAGPERVRPDWMTLTIPVRVIFPAGANG